MLINQDNSIQVKDWTPTIIYYFIPLLYVQICELRADAKCQNPRKTPSRRSYHIRKEREKVWNAQGQHKYSALTNTFCLQHQRAAHTLRTDQYILSAKVKKFQ